MRARHVFALSVLSCILATHVAIAETTTIGKMKWLLGDWMAIKQTAAPTFIVEKWSSAGRAIINVGYTVKEDSLLDYELVVIREAGARFLYEAHPMGQEPAVFHSIKIGDKSIVFENLEHDFPHRVGYELVSNDSLLAWIEGPGTDGKTKRIEFPYRRVK